MQRPIIVIDREKCNGCGKCVRACAEGALELVDGKAVLVKEDFCDGLGACIGDCPTGALRIERREAPPFTAPHPAPHSPPPAGCPGMKVRNAAANPSLAPTPPAAAAGQAIPSELRQWPVQLHLVPPGAPFLRGRELLLLNACGAVASADVHWRFLRGRAVVVACPKLSSPAEIRDKLAAILAEAHPPAVLVARMEVPCCRALVMAVRAAAAQAGQPDLPITEMEIKLNGDVAPG